MKLWSPRHLNQKCLFSKGYFLNFRINTTTVPKHTILPTLANILGLNISLLYGLKRKKTWKDACNHWHKLFALQSLTPSHGNKTFMHSSETSVLHHIPPQDIPHQNFSWTVHYLPYCLNLLKTCVHLNCSNHLNYALLENGDLVKANLCLSERT